MKNLYSNHPPTFNCKLDLPEDEEMMNRIKALTLEQQRRLNSALHKLILAHTAERKKTRPYRNDLYGK